MFSDEKRNSRVCLLLEEERSEEKFSVRRVPRTPHWQSVGVPATKPAAQEKTASGATVVFWHHWEYPIPGRLGTAGSPTVR